MVNAGTQAPETEWYIATVTAWSNATGVELRLDGDSSSMTKRYPMMKIPRPLVVGERVLVMKQSGTYFVIGALGMPNSWQRINDLANDATTADIISKINAILAWLRQQGILTT